MNKIRKPLFAFFLILSLVSCAKRGTITGGDKDITAPKIILSSPANFSTNFDKKSIKIYFNEYVKIKDLQKQLVVSPPLNTPLTILPQGIPSKVITIKISDTLKPNTTYSLNFGQSIVDYNEGNPYPQLKYVFSTGAKIDSLSIQGTIKDSYEKKTPNFVNVMLYDVESDDNDSLIFKQNPRYITNTLDSTSTFKIENIKAGKYKLIALKEKSTNYKFDPNKDQIAFYNKIINIPDSTIYNLELFKEEPKFKTQKPIQSSGNRLFLPYTGNAKNARVQAKIAGNDLPIIVTKLQNKDSLQIWFAPIKNDSISIEVQDNLYKKNYSVFLRNQKKDTLKITAVKNGVLDFNDNFSIIASVPLVKFDSSKMLLMQKDSAKVAFTTNYDIFKQQLEILFEKQPEQKYSLKILPNALEDYLGQKNDTLNFSFSTKNYSDYGNLKINLQNAKSFPIIVELTDKEGKIIATKYTESNPTLEYALLEPKKYTLRIIYDSNKNKVRDSGDYLNKIQPEEVIYYPSEIDVRANWDVDQAFDISKAIP